MKLLLLCALVGSISCGFKDKASKIYIGTALAPNHLDSDATYKSLAIANFNMLTPENEMKIDATEPSQNTFSYAAGDKLVTFAKANGMKVRGHTLVWHSQVPGWMNNIASGQLEGVMKNHITNVMGHWKGSIYAWDVVNEIFEENGQLRSSIWQKAMGEGFVTTAFQTAKTADSGAKLYINDYNIEGVNAKSTALYNLVKKLKGNGVPIEGVGFQSHFNSQSPVPSDFVTNLQRFADLGVDVAITELDIASNSDAAQATAYSTVIKDCLAVSRCVGVTIWGISDNYSWRSDSHPLPWDSSEKPKAAVIQAIENALQ